MALQNVKQQCLERSIFCTCHFCDSHGDYLHLLLLKMYCVFEYRQWRYIRFCNNWTVILTLKVSRYFQHFNLICRSQSRDVYVVSNYTANGTIGDNTISNELPIITHNQRDYYVVETEESGHQRRILIPVRSVTPPPSYDDLFNDK